MFLRLKEGVLREVLGIAFKKAGNIRKLEKQIGIPRTTLSEYHTEKRAVRENNLEKLEKFLGIKIKNEEIIEKLPDNWRQIIGGKNCVISKKKRGVFEKQLKECHKASSRFMKKHHKELKEINPEKYYISQYEKFKGIGGYKYITDNGEKVRNKLELDTANALKKNRWRYKYEPFLQMSNRAFFPDFLIEGKIILECTMWRGYDKAPKLIDKIKILSKKYKVYVLIPKRLNRYYKTLKNHLIFDINSILSPNSSDW